MGNGAGHSGALDHGEREYRQPWDRGQGMRIGGQGIGRVGLGGERT